MSDLSAFRGLKASRRPGQQDLDERLHRHLAEKGLAGFGEMAYITWLSTTIDIFEENFASQDQLEELQAAIDLAQGPRDIVIRVGVDKGSAGLVQRSNVRALRGTTVGTNPIFDYAPVLRLSTGQRLQSIADAERSFNISHKRWPEANTSSNWRPPTAEEEMGSAAYQHQAALSPCKVPLQRL